MNSIFIKMNCPRILALLTKPKQKVIESLRSFHESYALNQQSHPMVSRFDNKIQNPLFFTNLPKKKKKKRQIKLKPKKGPIPYGTLIINCKNSKLNHYSGMSYGKFDTVPLASKGWGHRKSKGDYFTILPTYDHPAFMTKEDLIDNFKENGISEKLIEQLEKIGVTHPTTVQAKACQHLLAGENVFMSAECGSGKTVCYLVTLIENILKWKQNISGTYNAPIGIIILPTRELAIQVGIVADKLGSELGIKCQTLIGGNVNELIRKPEMVPVDLLICTLKVLLEHLKSGLYTTVFCKHVVIDEADSFTDKSFMGQIKAFFNLSMLDFTGFTSGRVTNQSAQICFASATVPKDMENTLFSLIKGNEMKTISTSYLHRTISYAQQIFKRVSKQKKPEELLKIVKNNVKSKIPTMIFSNKKCTATWVSEFLNENGIDCGAVTTRLYASDRLSHYRDFEGGIINVISCTDLASRGLSFSRVKQVINFEFPSFMIDYIHRAGRTGRIGQGNDCKVINFICSRSQIHLLNKIELAVRSDSPLTSIHQDRFLNTSRNSNVY